MTETTTTATYQLIQQWEFLTVTDIAEAVNQPRRKLARFCEQQIVVPSGPSSGKGRPRLFAVWHVTLFKIALKLEAFGIKQSGLRRIMPVLNRLRSLPIGVPRSVNVAVFQDSDTSEIVAVPWSEFEEDPENSVIIQIDWRLAELDAVMDISRIPAHKEKCRGFYDAVTKMW